MIDLIATAATPPATGATGEAPEAGFDAVLAGVLGGEASTPEQGAAEEAAGEAATSEILAALATVAAAGTQIPAPPLAAEPADDAVAAIASAPAESEGAAVITALPIENAPVKPGKAQVFEARPPKAQGPKAPHLPNASERALVMAAAHSAVGRLAAEQAAAQAALAAQASAVTAEPTPAPVGAIPGGETPSPVGADAVALPEAPVAADPVVLPDAGPAATASGQADIAAATAADRDDSSAETLTTVPRRPAAQSHGIRPAAGITTAMGGDAPAPAGAAATAGVPAPQAAVEAFTATALHRVLEAAEAARERAPQAMTVEIGGDHPGEEALRLVVSVRGHTVHVAAHGGGGDGSLPPAWGRELAEALHQRGLELGGQGGGQRQASARDEAAAARPPAGAGRTARADKDSDDGALRL